MIIIMAQKISMEQKENTLKETEYMGQKINLHYSDKTQRQQLCII